MSNRNERTIEYINVLEIPDTLLEGEIFGYRKGSFTGAVKDYAGRLSTADNGTVFIDEIGKMPKYIQAKLLRFVQTGQYRRLGKKTDKKVDVRILAACHWSEVEPSDDESPSVISDLLYRLGYPDVIKLPTLHEIFDSKDYVNFDISLSKVLTTVLKKQNIREQVTIHTGCYAALKNYPFKGNYRELENILRRAIRKVLLSGRKLLRIDPSDLEPLEFDNPDYSSPSNEQVLRSIPLHKILDYAEEQRKAIIRAKIDELYDTGVRDMGNILKREGINKQSDYQRYLRQLGECLPDGGIRKYIRAKKHHEV